MKLLLESWKEFIAEEDEVSAQGISSVDLMKLSLPDFIAKAESDTASFLNGIRSGLKDGNKIDDMVKFESTNIKITDLIPTQNEVVFDQSIPFRLQNPQEFVRCRESDGPFKIGPPGNNAIITLNGTYILDGHHRWSSLFCVNPDASMATFDIKIPGISPENMLKLMQASIIAYSGEIPFNQGGGINLFDISEEELIQQIKKLLTPEIQQEFNTLGYSPETIQEIYIQNVSFMQSNNKPIPNATSRDFMPQTDAPKGSKVDADGGIPASLMPLRTGEIDFRRPFTKSQNLEEIVRQEVQKFLKEVYSEKQRNWACAQLNKNFKGKRTLTKKQAKEMCKGPMLEPKSEEK